jgi:DNA-directed RNA polymerase subunit RPC12/RpoP
MAPWGSFKSYLLLRVGLGIIHQCFVCGKYYHDKCFATTDGKAVRAFVIRTGMPHNEGFIIDAARMRKMCEMTGGVIPPPNQVNDLFLRVNEIPVDRLMRETTIDLCHTCYEDLLTSVLEKGVKNLEASGRFDDAAQVYEELGMLDEAGQERLKARSSTQTIKHVTVDLNQLLEKLRADGLALPYKCHSCGASIQINGDSRAEGLTFCSYCGTKLNTKALVDFLEAALK